MTFLFLLACAGDIEPATPVTDDTDGTVDPDDRDGDGYLGSVDDCDDDNPDINPGRSEGCDGLDNDCNGEIDDDPVDAETFYEDRDGDGWGDVNRSERHCESPGEDWVSTSGDCDDERSDINPDGQEVCDPTYEDEDCDGSSDDNDDSVDPAGFIDLYEDSDGDGYGNPDIMDAACHESTGWVADNTDCDDTSAALTPENACDLGWFGVYTGDFSFTGTEASFGSDTCAASGVEITIDPTANVPNQVSSSFICDWSSTLGAFIGPQTVNFEGEVHGDDTVTGGLFVGSAYVSSYEATLTEPGIFEGEFEGSDNSTGFTIDYVGSFSFSR